MGYLYSVLLLTALCPSFSLSESGSARTPHSIRAPNVSEVLQRSVLCSSSSACRLFVSNPRLDTCNFHCDNIDLSKNYTDGTILYCLMQREIRQRTSDLETGNNLLIIDYVNRNNLRLDVWTNTISRFAKLPTEAAYIETVLYHPRAQHLLIATRYPYRLLVHSLIENTTRVVAWDIFVLSMVRDHRRNFIYTIERVLSEISHSLSKRTTEGGYNVLTKIVLRRRRDMIALDKVSGTIVVAVRGDTRLLYYSASLILKKQLHMKLSAHMLAFDGTSGHLWAIVGTLKLLRMSPEGKVVLEIPLPLTPMALTVADDGRVHVFIRNEALEVLSLTNNSTVVVAVSTTAPRRFRVCTIP